MIKRLFFTNFIQTYQLDLTQYLCPLPLLMVRKILKTYPKPYQLLLILNRESESDIHLLCEKEKVMTIKKEIEDCFIQLYLEIK